MIDFLFRSRPAAAALVPSGASLTIGGSIIRRSPVALIRELIRQEKKGFTVLAWPHLALLVATRSDDPFRAELRNLLFD